MKVKALVREGFACGGEDQSIIGIQGRQGCCSYIFQNKEAEDTSYFIKKENTMNIYNYFDSTGMADATGPSGPRPIIYEPYTATYAYGYFDRPRHGSYNLDVTSSGIVLPFRTESYFSMNDFSYMIDSKGSYIKYILPWEGCYEITYQIYLKTAARVGARIRRDTYIDSDFTLEPGEPVTELAVNQILYGTEGDQISLELYSTSNLSVTLKGEIGAYILIKNLYM